MPVISSAVIEDRAQRDGRRAIRERHTDHQGNTHDAVYLAEAGANVAATMAARVATIEAQIKATEIAANLAKALNGETTGFTFQWSTANDNLGSLRAMYKTATRWELLTLAHVLHHQGLTNGQIQNLFSVSAGAQTTAVRDRLAALDAKYHDVLDDAGD